MGGNGLSISGGSADIEFTDGTDIYGFKFQQDSWLTETRGSAYVGQISSGGSTYQDAEPWKRKVYDNFLGGMGQTNDNKVYGGTGIGGDDTKYFYGDCKTDRAGYLLPGMARNLIYNTITAAKTPISDNADPVAGDECEVPRGVLPAMLAASIFNNFTTTATTPTVTNLRVLCLFNNPSASGTVTITAYIETAPPPTGVIKGTYSITINRSTFGNYTGWKWITLPLTSGTGTLAASTTYTVEVTPPATDQAAIGCYGGSGNYGNNSALAYFQLMTSATPFKWWSAPLARFEQVLNGTTYINTAITATSLFNTALTNSGGSVPATSPEVGLGGTFTSSLVFNKNLYVGTTGTIQVFMFTPANLAANAAATSTTNSIGMSSAVAYGGYIYGVNDPTTQNIYKWTGAFPVTIGTIAGGQNLEVLMAPGAIGDPGTKINNIFVYQGNLWVIKPEGLFQLYADPAIISTAPGNTPRIVPVVTDLPSAHQDTGRWYCIHQGMIYFNYRDRIYQVLPGVSGPPQVTALALPIPWYRLSYYHYVNGITSDGVNLYVSYNNLGVYQYTNQVWHPVTEFYELVAVESQGSGLRWLPNPASAPDNLFVGDGATLVQLPIPSATAPYTSQIYQNHQNKCGYLITSATDMEQAEIVKYIHSGILRAVANGFSYKVVAVAWQTGSTSSFKTLLEKTWREGLSRSTWNATLPAINYNHGYIVTTKVDPFTGNPVTNSLAPMCWASTDFDNLFYSSEKLASTTNDTTANPVTTDVLTNPAKYVQTAFILYWWNPTAGRHATTGVDLMAIDSLVIKYQAVQDYLAQYQCVIDFHAKVSGSSATALTTQQIEDSYDWLRSQTGRHSPLKATFKVRKTGTTTKSILFLPQNPNWLIDASTANQPDGTTPGDPRIKTVGLQMISVQSEYPNV